VTRVRFSPDIFRIERFGGVSRYVVELHRGLLARGVDSRILAGLHRSGALVGTERVLGASVERVRPERLRQAITKVADRGLERAWAAGQDRSTIYHKTYFDWTVPTGPTLAVTVYDMIHERYPEELGPRDHTVEAKRRWCERADLVFAISQQTRVDLLERYRLDPDKVVVTHLGVAAVEPDGTAPPIGGRPFVLYVGNRSRPYKNWSRVLEVMARMPSELGLVCFGPDRTAAEAAAVSALGLDDRVGFVGGDDGRLATAYQAATALLYPSLYEGFGLPPLEAMAHGCPVVAARAGSLPEVLGDAAILVDPTDLDAWVDALTTVVAGGAVAESLRLAGPGHAAGYTWARTAEATLAGYRLVAP
jgi:glycosyltransferase involved in cell wall biosynthesis